MAALDVYRDRAVTVIIGGHDRGIDYDALIERLRQEPRPGVVLMDASGRRIHPRLGYSARVRLVDSMCEAVAQAREMTPRGGVVLLSPAAPSYGRVQELHRARRGLRALPALALDEHTKARSTRAISLFDRVTEPPAIPPPVITLRCRRPPSRVPSAGFGPPRAAPPRSGSAIPGFQTRRRLPRSAPDR